MKLAPTIKAAAAAAILGTSTSAFAAPSVVNTSITEADVVAAQQGWCDALVDISAAHRDEGQAAAATLAGDIIDAAYGYQMGAVLFKPTLTVNPQTFRPTREGALSYFVGGNDSFPTDSGFALKDWTKCEVANNAVFITGESASTIGKVHFTNSAGETTSVDKSWKFVKDDAGQMRIVLHHSSLEYTGS